MDIIRYRTFKPLNIVERFYFRFKKVKSEPVLHRITVDIMTKLYRNSNPKVKNIQNIVDRDVKNKFRKLVKEPYNYEWFDMHYIDSNEFEKICERKCKFYKLTVFERRQVFQYIYLAYSPTSSYLRWRELYNKYINDYKKLIE